MPGPAVTSAKRNGGDLCATNKPGGAGDASAAAAAAAVDRGA